MPDTLIGAILPGMRVTVPFGRGNSRCDGLVLAISNGEVTHELKWSDAPLDSGPVLSDEQLKLALWMR